MKLKIFFNNIIMCGIFALLNKEINNNIYKSFLLGQSRGPENSIIQTGSKTDNIILGFHRLAINGLDMVSNQPINLDYSTLICNGEIYNYKELAIKYNFTLNTNSDCEIILHLYNKFGILETLTLLDGVFAFILIDNKKNKIFVARDRFGVRPLFERNMFSKEINSYIYGFASELKVLNNINIDMVSNNQIISFTPGTYSEFSKNNNNIFNKNKEKIYYYQYPEINTFLTDINEINQLIVNNFNKAIYKRVVGTSERPIACLLSGGLDSSLVCALVTKYYGNKIETYSIGLEGSEDLKYATIVANHLNTKHTNIILTEDEFFSAIPAVIQTIESYDTTTIRASVGNYLIGKYIKENSNAKVIFNGDGSDELMGGYLYFNAAPNSQEFDKECKRLLTDIHYFDVLRSDRCISAHGLEPRTPFLDINWVTSYLSIPENIRCHTSNNNCEKFLIRNAFSILEPNLLPKEILWRTKEAFSDGVSSLNKSWFKIIDEKVTQLYVSNLIQKEITPYLKHKDSTLEKAYYRYLFDCNYKNNENIIPYLWMPKFIEAKDSSARTLSIYKN